MYIEFIRPFYLAFLFVIPVIVFLYFYSLKNLKGRALDFANFEAIARVKGIDLYSKKNSLLLFDIFVVVLLIFALAGLSIFKEVNASSFSFVVAIDSSQSMSAVDMTPNRLESAKIAAKEFIDSLPVETYVSIVSFSGNVLIEQELTKNKQQLKSGIDNIQISSIGGTDVYESVFASIEILKNENNKAIILISDGQINAGPISSVIDYSKRNKIIIHTIAIGTIEGGETIFGISKLDEESLKALAYNTGGVYIHAENKEEMKKSFSDLYSLTRKVGEFDLTPYLIIICIFLFISKQFLIETNKILW